MARPAVAVTPYYWDINGSTTGSGSATPSGTWDSTTANWSTTSTGTITTVPWLNDGTAVPTFAAGSDATGTYTVTVVGTQQIGGFTTEEGSVTLTGGTLNLSGGTAFGGGGTATFVTPITSSAGGTITKSGAGTVFIAGPSTFTNPVNLTGGLLQIVNNGSAQSMGDVTMVAGTAFVIDNSGANVANRFNDASQVVYNAGGNFAFTGAAGYATSETIGNVVVSNDLTKNVNSATSIGFNTTGNLLTLNGGSGGTLLTANQLQVQPGAMLLMRGANIGATSNQFKLADTSTLVLRGGGGTTATNKSVVNGVLGANTASAGAGTDFVTYNASSGFAVLQAADYATSITAGDTSQSNVAISAPQTLSGNATIGAMKFTGTGSLTMSAGTNLSLNSGMVLFGSGATVSGGTITVPGDTPLMFVTQQNSAVSSAIAGSNFVSKNGTGTLTLSGNSTYSAPTVVAAGMLVAASNNALGDASQGTVVSPGATLRLDGTAAPITVAEPITISARTTQTLRGTANVMAQGIDLLSNSPAWTGGLDVSGNVTATGTIRLDSPTSNISDIRTPTISTEPGAVLTITQPFAGPNAGGVPGLAFTGAGTTILQADNLATLNGGNVVRLWGGTIILQNGNALGGSGLFGAFGINYVRTTLALQAPVGSPGITVNTPIGQLAGYGNGSAPVLENISGDNTFAGVISLSNVANTTNINYNSYQPLFWGIDSGSLTIPTTMVWGGQRHIVKSGTGSLIWTSKQTMPGPTDVLAGTLTIGGTDGYVAPGSGSISNAINVSSGGTLFLDQSNVKNDGTALNFIDDFGDGPMTEPINLFGGELKLKGNIGVAQNLNFQGSAQSTMPLTAYGTSTLTVVDSGSGTTITAPSRVNGETYLIRGVGGGAHVMLTTDGSGLVGAAGGAIGTPTVSIYPSAIGDTSASGTGTDFVTYDAAANSYRPLNGSEYTALTDGNGTLVNATASGATPINTATTVNSLKLTAANVSLGNTLNVNSGAILAVGGSSSISGGSVALGSEGVFFATAGNTLSVSSPISGSNGLTLAGSGTINLTGNNTFTGKFQVDGGTVNVSSDSNLGDAGNTLALGGGTFAPAAAYTSTARNVTVLGQPKVGLSGGQTFSMSGVVSGTGRLGVTGNGTLVLSGANTWTGESDVSNGATLSFANLGAVGPNEANDGSQPTRDIRLDGGTVQFASSMDLGAGHPIYLGKGGGTIDVPGGAVVSWDVTGGNTPIYGPGGLHKTGPGTFEIKSGSTTSINYDGGTFVDGGVLQVDVASSVPTLTAATTTTVNNGGDFRINNVNVTSQDLVLNNGATLSGLGAATYSGGGGTTTANPQIASGATVTFKGVNAGDTLTIGGAMVDLGATPTINVDGAGTVAFGTAENAAFTANYVVKNGATMRLGTSSTATAVLGAASNTITIDTTGGTLQPRIGAARTYGPYPVTVNGPTTINMQSSTAAGGTAFVATFGTLKVNGDQTITLTHNGAADGNGIIAGTLGGATFGATTLAGNPTFNVSNPQDDATGVGRITLGALSETGGSRSITKQGNGDLTLGGAGTITGSVNLNAGSLTVTSTPTVGRVVQTAGTTLTINGTSAKLTLKAGGTTGSLLTAVPTFTGTTPELDITNNSVVVDYTGSSLATAVRGVLQTGYNGGAWTGKGIVSANAKNDVKKVTGIRYYESSLRLGPTGGTFGNVSADGSAILMDTGYYGDINFDGTVNADDYALLDRGAALFGTGTAATWVNGDFNYDGVVNSADYLLADTAYGVIKGVLSPDLLAAREAEFGSDYVSALVAAVPEPTSVGLIGLAGAAVIGRRRRK